VGSRSIGPQHDRDQILLRFVVEGQGRHQGQIAPGVIVSIEEGERLLHSIFILKSLNLLLKSQWNNSKIT
jgi:hypothetical protein